MTQDMRALRRPGPGRGRSEAVWIPPPLRVSSSREVSGSTVLASDLQAGVCGPLVQASRALPAPMAITELTVVLSVKQLPERHSQPFGIFQFPAPNG